MQRRKSSEEAVNSKKQKKHKILACRAPFHEKQQKNPILAMYQPHSGLPTSIIYNSQRQSVVYFLFLFMVCDHKHISSACRSGKPFSTHGPRVATGRRSTYKMKPETESAIQKIYPYCYSNVLGTDDVKCIPDEIILFVVGVALGR